MTNGAKHNKRSRNVGDRRKKRADRAVENHSMIFYRVTKVIIGDLIRIVPPSRIAAVADMSD